MKKSFVSTLFILLSLSLSSCFGTAPSILSIDQGEVSNLHVGDELQLSVTARITLPSTSVLTWTSSNSNFASVDANGLVQALKVGSAVIKVQSSERYSDSILINIAAADLKIDLASEGGLHYLDQGETLQLYPSIAGETNYNFVFNSSNREIATVDSHGLVSGHSPGEVQIEAMCLLNSKTLKGKINLTVYSADLAPLMPDVGEGYYKAQSLYMNSYELNRSQFRKKTMLPLGEQKILLVPVKFDDGPTWDQARLNNLETVYFGDRSDTGWESVSSFYERSSYGKLHLRGELYPYTIDMDMSILEGVTRYGDTDLTTKVIDVFYDHAISNSFCSRLIDFDQDADGYMDLVVFVYSHDFDFASYDYDEEYEEAFEDTYWAWQHWIESEEGPNGVPRVVNHTWLSYEFMFEGYGPESLDAHTFTHEMGHALGLNDYYDTTDRYMCPAGGLEMMDYNILDHNAYSKMDLNWTKPYVIDGRAAETTIHINSLEFSGDCIIINDDWNGSANDEYIMIEFYTPTGLNEQDSLAPYPGNGMQGYTIPGVKIYHIDARVYQLTEFIDSYEPGTGRAWIYNSNTAEYSKYMQVQLMEAGGVNTLTAGKLNHGKYAKASNETLFQTGDEFFPSAEFFREGDNTFNDGSTIGYKVIVESLHTNYATIKVVKI